MKGKLTAISGPLQGQTFDLPDQGKIAVGREPTSQVVINIPHVSRIHCFLEVTPQGITVQDNHSSNGTQVNGKMVRIALLKDGDEISVGPAVFRFELEKKAKTETRPFAPPDLIRSSVCSGCRSIIAKEMMQGGACRQIGDSIFCPKCIKKMGLVGRDIAGYRVLALLGKGAVGAVYKAVQLSLGRPVALKVLHPGVTSVDAVVKRFLREARRGAQLRHPNIVEIYDQGVEEGLYYIAMEFVEGQTLHDLVAKQGPLSAKEAARYFVPICMALHHAHRLKIVHRDIKPGNIMISPKGVPKLADLGLAKNFVEEGINVTANNMAVGTPGYMAPEQGTDAGTVDHLADVFGLGASLFHAVTGHPPFAGRSPVETIQRTIADPPEPISKFNPGISAPFENIILRAMAKDPKQRFPSAEEMAMALSPFMYET